MVENKMHFRQTNNLMPFPKRLMIIEDDRLLAEVLAHIFTDQGYYCHLAGDAPDVNAIAAFKPDLIIIDYYLPTRNGDEVCQAIKNHHLLKTIPVIVISAYSNVLLSQDGFAFDLFVEKPFTMEEIVKPVNDLVYKKQFSHSKEETLSFRFTSGKYAH